MKLTFVLKFMPMVLSLLLCMISCENNKRYNEKRLLSESKNIYMVGLGIDNSLGVIDGNGKIIIPQKYSSINYVKDFDFFLVKEKTDDFEYEQMMVFDINGHQLLPNPRSLFTKSFKSIDFLWNEEIFKVSEDGELYQLYNMEGYAISEEYSWIYQFNEGLAAVTVKTNTDKRVYGYINEYGREVIPLVLSLNQGEMPNFFSQGLACVCYKGKWGFIDYTGKEIIPFIYDYAYTFPLEGAGFRSSTTELDKLAAVYKNGKWGFVNLSGKVVIPLIYDRVAWIFQNGSIEVLKKTERYYIDTKGKRIPFNMPSFSGYNQIK